MASISLVMVVQHNFCDRDFVIDHKFSMGLRGLDLASFPVMLAYFFLSENRLRFLK